MSTALKTKAPPALTNWVVETCHLVTGPQYIEASNIEDLRSQVRAVADSKRVRTDRPPIGELMYRYELDADDRIDVVHVYFEGRNRARVRFMRLRRDA